MKEVLILQFFLIVAIFGNAQIFEIDTIQYSGDGDKRINIVILSDGYQENELDQFVVDANNFSDAFFAKTPYLEYQNYFNVFAIKVPSNESGASHPGTASDVAEPAHPISMVDNYFGSTFDGGGIHRLLVVGNTSAVSNVLALNFPTYDQVLILANTTYYGGSGGTFPVASLDESSNEIAIHEIGHSFARLVDEYYAGDQFAGEGVNMTQTTDPLAVRWKNWISSNGIGIYQHCCSGNSGDWFRPHENCIMRYLNRSFCSVCIEGTIERIHSLILPIDDFAPSNSTTIIATENPIGFSINTVDPLPNTLQTNWSLNGLNFENNTNVAMVTNSDLNVGENTLTVSVEDTTQLLRVDDHEIAHIQFVIWSIENNTV